jgi:hypothetical protein
VNKESNLTPAVETDLKPMDHYIHDMVIVNLMCSVFKETRSGWYDAANTESALDFFLGQPFFCAPLSSYRIPHLTSTAVDKLPVLTCPLKMELS